jgi:hypothetical protein
MKAGAHNPRYLRMKRAGVSLGLGEGSRGGCGGWTHLVRLRACAQEMAREVVKCSSAKAHQMSS